MDARIRIRPSHFGHLRTLMAKTHISRAAQSRRASTVAGTDSRIVAVVGSHRSADGKSFAVTSRLDDGLAYLQLTDDVADALGEDFDLQLDRARGPRADPPDVSDVVVELSRRCRERATRDHASRRIADSISHRVTTCCSLTAQARRGGAPGRALSSSFSPTCAVCGSGQPADVCAGLSMCGAHQRVRAAPMDRAVDRRLPVISQCCES